MDSTVFKYNHHQHHQQQQQQQQYYNNNSSGSGSSSSSNNIQNNNNQNSIFILNTATNNILANNPKLYYNDFNDNNNVEPSLSSNNATSSSSSTSTSVWSSASSTMCSPAAHAIQKLFNCSSNSSKLNQGNYSGIETKSFKSNAELLKKKNKFWKYLEGETNENNNINYNSDHQQYAGGIDVVRNKEQGKSRKTKSKYWSKSYDSDNQNNQDLSDLLEYSCSLCDNCRCIDCQITYFDCENSDDSNSEYSFHMNAYEEDDDDGDEGKQLDVSDVLQQEMELKITKANQNTQQTLNVCNKMDNKHSIHKLDSKQITSYDENFKREINYECDRCCQQCFDKQVKMLDTKHDILTTNRDH